MTDSTDTTTGTTTTTARPAARDRTLARTGVAGALVGAAQAVAILAWPPAVGPEQWSYPFTSGGVAVAQVCFAVQHLLLVAGLVALLGTARGRAVRGGLWAAVAGTVLLTAQEVVALVLVGERAGSPAVQLVEALYGVPTILLGGALLVAAVGVLRGGTVLAPRWALLATGAWVPLALVPGLTAGFTAGRVVIGVWMLLFGWLFLRAARN